MVLRSRVVAVVLAAGASSRFGSSKLLERFGRTTLLERTLNTVKRSRIDETILVLGHEADQMRQTIDLRGVRVVINSRYRAGLSSSVRVGIKAVTCKADAALIVLADQPFLTHIMIDRIIRAYEMTGARIVAPTHKGRQGNPVLFDRSLFREISNLSGDRGAKQVIRNHWSEVLKIESRDPCALFDIDTRKDLKKVLEYRFRKAISKPSRR